MVSALDRYVIGGVRHNVNFLRSLLTHQRFAAAKLTTGFIPEEYPEGYAGHALTTCERRDLLAATAALELAAERQAQGCLEESWRPLRRRRAPLPTPLYPPRPYPPPLPLLPTHPTLAHPPPGEWRALRCRGTRERAYAQRKDRSRGDETSPYTNTHYPPPPHLPHPPPPKATEADQLLRVRLQDGGECSSGTLMPPACASVMSSQSYLLIESAGEAAEGQAGVTGGETGTGWRRRLQLRASCLAPDGLFKAVIDDGEVDDSDGESSGMAHAPARPPRLLVVQVHERRPLGWQLLAYGSGFSVLSRSQRAAELQLHMKPPASMSSARSLVSPMPGALVSVAVVEGEKVGMGQELCIVEAMKMQASVIAHSSHLSGPIFYIVRPILPTSRKSDPILPISHTDNFFFTFPQAERAHRRARRDGR